jgi:hypothetical protein
MEKIDFESAAKDLPLDRESIAQSIANIPLDILVEYIDGVKLAQDRLSQIAGTLQAAAGPLCLDQLRKMGDGQLENLRDIVEVLNDIDVLQRIDRMIELTHRIPVVSGKKKEKIDALLNEIKKLDKYKLETVTNNCIGFQQQYFVLSRILCFYLGKQKSDLALKRFLGKIDADLIDTMISTCSVMEKTYESIS